jgi:hypothetical protein
VAVHLRRFIDAGTHGTVFAESGFALPRHPATVRGPDVSFVTDERLATARPLRTFPELAPDLAVEVVSPSNPLFTPAQRTPASHRQSAWPRRVRAHRIRVASQVYRAARKEEHVRQVLLISVSPPEGIPR